MQLFKTWLYFSTVAIAKDVDVWTYLQIFHFKISFSFVHFTLKRKNVYAFVFSSILFFFVKCLIYLLHLPHDFCHKKKQKTIRVYWSTRTSTVPTNYIIKTWCQNAHTHKRWNTFALIKTIRNTIKLNKNCYNSKSRVLNSFFRLVCFNDA